MHASWRTWSWGVSAALVVCGCGEPLEPPGPAPVRCEPMAELCFDDSMVDSRRAYFDARERLIVRLEADASEAPEFFVRLEFDAPTRMELPEMWQIGEVRGPLAYLHVREERAEGVSYRVYRAEGGSLSVDRYDPNGEHLVGRLRSLTLRDPDAVSDQQRLATISSITFDLECLGRPLREDPCEATCGVCVHEDHCGNQLEVPLTPCAP